MDRLPHVRLKFQFLFKGDLVTITRVGTNEKYSSGWEGIFGGKTSKKVAKASPVAAKPTEKKAVKKSAAVKAAPKKAAKKAAKKTAKKK
jgi:hypothetical protein